MELKYKKMMICGCFGGSGSIGCTYGRGDAKDPGDCEGTGDLGSTNGIGGKDKGRVPLLHRCFTYTFI